MAFTRDELWAGGGWAWVAFNALLVTAITVVAVWSEVAAAAIGAASMGGGTIIFVVFYTLLIGGGLSFGVMVAGLPAAWLVGRALRRVGSVPAHLAVHGLLGALLGVLVVGVYAVTIGGGRVLEIFSTSYLPITVALTTTSVVFGWWMASRRGRSEPHREDRRSPLGIDEAFDHDASLR